MVSAAHLSPVVLEEEEEEKKINYFKASDFFKNHTDLNTLKNNVFINVFLEVDVRTNPVRWSLPFHASKIIESE